jgi:hypothetical protein
MTDIPKKYVRKNADATPLPGPGEAVLDPGDKELMEIAFGEHADEIAEKIRDFKPTGGGFSHVSPEEGKQ